jgi:hypothetical protein
MTGVRDPLVTGPGMWDADPVRASMVAAHLVAVRGDRLAFSSGVRASGDAGVSRPAPRGLLRRSRVRVGHALVALGGFVAGSCELADRSAMRAR